MEGDWPTVGGPDGVPFFAVPRPLTSDRGLQRELFHSAITGPWMANVRKRGFPYTWIPNHLADAYGIVSPRSFIAALGAAAFDTAERHPDHAFALHYDSVKRGVREASTIRAPEIREGYPWIDRLLQPLSGIVVPCAFEEIAAIWDSGEILSRLTNEIGQDEVRLPPRNLERGAIGIREDLESLGVFRRLRDERVDIPDVYRVRYGLGRKGGLKPVK